jgi:hypothetical protein
LLEAGWGVLRGSRSSLPVRYASTIVIVGMLACFQFGYHIKKLPEEMRFAREQISLQEHEHNLIGKILRQTIPASEWLVVYMDAGAIPYFSGLRTVDFGALNDEYLARSNAALSERIDYFYARNPGAVVFTSTNKDRVDYGEEVAAIVADPRFQEYTLAKKYLSPLPLSKDYQNYHEFLFLRKDLAAR